MWSWLLVCVGILLFKYDIMARNNTPTNCVTGARSLSDIHSCIIDTMPLQGHFNDTRPFLLPNIAQTIEWRNIVDAMLRLNNPTKCDRLRTTLSSLRDIYTIKSVQNLYCVLLESDKTNVRGWGTLFVKLQPRSTSSLLDLHLSAAHPLTDGYVQEQAFQIFTKSNIARSYLLAGTVRSASMKPSSCQNTNYETDVAHNVNNLFHHAVIQTAIIYSEQGQPDLVHVQLHGMAETSCPGVTAYAMPGVTTTSNDTYFTTLLESISRESKKRGLDWNVTTYGRGMYCNLHGSTNVQGRVLNDMSKICVDTECLQQVCTINVDKPAGTFIHIEQKRESRDQHDLWITAIDKAWSRQK
jgi:hypothetical protein